MDQSLIDFKALSEPACKLIDAVSSSIGVVYEPTRIRRKAKAEAEALVIMAKGEEEALAARAAVRLSTQEIYRQENIESILNKSVELVDQTIKVDKSPPKRDWLSFFFDKCKDVSEEEVQSAWSAILAGEFDKPNSFRRVTLTVLQSMNESDVKLFERYCSYVFRLDGKLTRIKFSAHNKELAKKDITEEEILHLQDLGLLQEPKICHFNKGATVIVEYGANRFSSTFRSHRQNKAEYLTMAGRELYSIINLTHSDKYGEILLSRFQIMSKTRQKNVKDS
ncbi:DUF2806 domain-containing protein [Paraferrimonas sp. SM1919]|uniref:DUF2806 domain-containing protein n=1 Tax=Paraferrimonas sp. SM1919 TaxID=2662263 RepID=UPI0013CFE76F|nr:DUF2806 domain-containing protein [Paraferrimonas sp. SM1919]